MTQPHPDDEWYDDWLEDQMARGMDQDGCVEHRDITADVSNELAVAVKHALNWLDVPTLLLVVAEEMRRFDQAQEVDDASPF